MTRTLGGMEILGEISTGGMGAVLLARRSGAHGFEKLVAIKTIRAELAERDDIRELFLDEARLVARIQHPSVAQVYDFGEDRGALFLAMEYVQGVSLEAILEKHGPLPPGVAAQIAQQACRGLHAAHELTDAQGRSLNVVHRDVSPSNLMLTFDGGVKILDFGIALMRDRSAPITQVGRLRGKVAYMAPEQLAGELVDRRTDVWGLANVLFELLTASRLRGDLDLREISDALDRAPPAPSSLVPSIPAKLDEVVMRGLARSPMERPRNARELANELEVAIAELGGERLEEFALRALAVEREEHQRTRGQAPMKSRGPTVVASGATPAPPLIATSPGGRRPLISIAAAGGACGIGIALLFLAQPRPAEPKHEPKHEPLPMVATTADPPATALQPPPPPAPVTLLPVRTVRAPRPSRPRPPPRRAPEDGFGFLTIGAHPYAVVVIDGAELGLTPLLRVRLPAGVHQVRLLDPATRRERSTQKVSLASGQHERLTFR